MFLGSRKFHRMWKLSRQREGLHAPFLIVLSALMLEGKAA